jgi:hypothetical protein
MFKAIKQDSIADLARVMKRKGMTPNSIVVKKNRIVYTVFTYCIFKGARCCFQWCMENGANPNVRLKGPSAFTLAAMNPAVFMKPLLNYANLNINLNDFMYCWKRQYSDEEAKIMLVDIFDHPNLIAEDESPETITTFLASMLCKNARIAFEYGIKNPLFKYYPRRILELTAHLKIDREIIKYLMDCVDNQDIDELKSIAIRAANLQMVEILLERNPNVTSRMVDRSLAQLNCVFMRPLRQYKILEMLLELGGKPGAESHKFWTDTLTTHPTMLAAAGILYRHGYALPHEVLRSMLTHWHPGSLMGACCYLMCYDRGFDIFGVIRDALIAVQHYPVRSNYSEDAYRLLADVVIDRIAREKNSEKKEQMIGKARDLIGEFNWQHLDTVLKPYMRAL